MMKMLRMGALLAAGVLVFGGCKSPRSPREHAAGDLSGRWTAESVAVGEPHDTGTMRWELVLAQHPAGRLTGEGTLTGRGGGGGSFTLHGLRDRHEVHMKLGLPAGRATFRGGVHSMQTMVGELYLENDTLPVTFTRETMTRRKPTPAPRPADATPR